MVANFAYFSLKQVIPVSNALGIALDNKGNIYAWDGNSIFNFDSAGQLTKQIPGFGNVFSILVQGDVVYVANYSNNCIKIQLTPSIEVTGTISLPKVKYPAIIV